MNTVFLTVISGTVIFIIGQFLQKFYFKPIESWKGILSEIDSNLFIFQNILVTDVSDEALSYETPPYSFLPPTPTVRTTNCEGNVEEKCGS